jgi:hypothetical protein
MGDIGFYAEWTIIAMDLFLGTILDIFGRKYPTIIGFILAGLSIILIPFGK